MCDDESTEETEGDGGVTSRAKRQGVGSVDANSDS